MSSLDQIRKDVWNPPPDLDPISWVLENVKSIPYSPYPNFDPDLRPALKPVMEAIADPRRQLVVLLCAVQNWKSIALELSIVRRAAVEGQPMALFLPKEQMASNVMTTRLRPLMENTPAVKRLIPTGANRDKATKSLIVFKNNANFWCMGAAEKNLQGNTIQVVHMDECWQLPAGSIRQAEKRISAFGPLGKLILASQGSEPDAEYAEYWETTNQSDWSFVCPDCETRQVFSLKQLKFDPIKSDAGDYDYQAIAKTVELECVNEACLKRFTDSDATRRDLSNPKNGAAFLPMNLEASPGRVGFRETAISTMSWAFLIEEWLRAKVASYRGDFGPLKLFHMQRLASFYGDAADEDFKLDVTGAGYKAAEWEQWQDDQEEWAEGAISMQGGMLRIVDGPASDKGKAFARLRFLSVDVQRDHFWGGVRSFTPDGKSRLLWAGKIHSWEEIQSMGVKYEVAPSLTFIDCGDKPFADQGVYEYASRYGFCCLRGDGRTSFNHKSKVRSGATTQKYYSPVRWINLGQGRKKKVRVHHFSSLQYRDMLHRLMQMPDRWQLPDDLAEMCPDYEEQISSQRRGKTKTGRPTWITYGKAGEHLADVEVQCLVAGNMCRIVGAEVEEEQPEEIDSDE